MSVKLKETKYVICVTFTEPQIIDMRRVFFIECKDHKPQRRKSAAPPLRRSMSRQMENIDCELTKKIQSGDDFDSIWSNLNVEDKSSFEKKKKRNKSFCLEDCQSP